MPVHWSKTRGVKIYVVVVGSYVHGMDKRVKIASFPPQNQLLRLKDIAGFWNLIQLTVKQVSLGKYIVNYDPTY